MLSKQQPSLRFIHGGDRGSFRLSMPHFSTDHERPGDDLDRDHIRPREHREMAVVLRRPKLPRDEAAVERFGFDAEPHAPAADSRVVHTERWAWGREDPNP